jgi:uncharacterized membrane protein
MKRERYYLLDVLRGVTLISMMAYHAMYDLVAIYGKPYVWFWTTSGYVWQQSICWTFILLSGFCWKMGRNPLKRGLVISAGGLIITVVTVIFMSTEAIYFGILTFAGAAMLLMIPADRLFLKVPAELGLAVSAVLFLVTRNINDGYWGFENLILGSVPEMFYQNGVMTFLGFPAAGFSSGDYFSLFPWFFLYMCGYFIYGIHMKTDRIKAVLQIRFRPLEWIGRHSLPIYMVHQPVILGVCMLIF